MIQLATKYKFTSWAEMDDIGIVNRSAMNTVKLIYECAVGIEHLDVVSIPHKNFPVRAKSDIAWCTKLTIVGSQ